VTNNYLAGNYLVNAKFNVYGMLGNPVAQTETPALFNQYCRKNNRAAVMVPFKLSGTHDLDNLIQMMKNSQFLSGFVSTIPFKADLYDLCDHCGPDADILGKVNAVKISSTGKVLGEMFDGIGFVEALKLKKFTFPHKNCLIIGCGTAGQAIAIALTRNGVSKCTLVDTNVSALEKFNNIPQINNETYHLMQTVPNDISMFDLIINASPIGMKANDPLPCNLETVRIDSFVGDCTTNFETTPFIHIAKQKGCPVITGADMASGHLLSIVKFFNLVK